MPVPAAAAEGLAAEGQAAASGPRQRQLGPHRLRAASPPKGRACAKKEEMAVPMDGLAFAALVHTLHTGWTGGLVSRITQPEPAYIVFHLRHRRENASLHCLLDQNEPVLWAARGDDSDDPAFAANDQRPGAHPSPFCMLLRKHLEGARLVAVRQTGWDRLIHLDFQVASDWREGRSWTFTLELIPRRANGVLIDPQEGKIVDALLRRPGRADDRSPGAAYVPPPSPDRVPPDAGASVVMPVLRLAPAHRPLARHMAAHIDGLSAPSAREILARAGVDPDWTGPLDEPLSAQLAAVLADMARRCREGDVEPSVCWKTVGDPLRDPGGLRQEPADVWAFPFTETAAADGTWVRCDSMAEAVRIRAEASLRAQRLEARRRRLERAVRAHLKRAQRKLTRRQEDFAKAEQAARHKRWADLLMANAHQLAGAAAGSSSITVVDWYGQPDDSGALPKVTIPLDPTMSPMDNARRYYRLYRRYHQAAARMEANIREAEEEAAYLEHVELALQWNPGPEELEELEQELMAGGYVDAPQAPARNRKKERVRTESRGGQPYRFRFEDGSEVRVGRNNRQNDRLTMGWARPDDVWLHARGVPGAHVIWRPAPAAGTEELDPEGLRRAAALAAWFSRARGASHVPVDYTFRRYVRKPRGARPGMVVYERERTIFVTPDAEEIAALWEQADDPS